mmetsp:Transcript_19785/g.29123  ORF Transcript_19785/g.29123 Transcript_19785/m.29123 type:complete len:2165 (-) Transcript_19785:27-6521(-)
MKLSLSGLALLSSTLATAPVHVHGTPGTVLGGPFPKGWTTTSNVEDAASLAIDMGYVYEYPTLRQRKEVFETGKSIFSELTLSDIGKSTSRANAKDPLRNYYINAFDAIGQYLSNSDSGSNSYIQGYFDGYPAEDYHNTLIADLFDAEATEAPVRGIEKEAVLILSIWMNIYHTLYTDVYLICRDGQLDDDGNLNIDRMMSGLDNAAALWIGHLQVHGDNNRGTMLYNLSERISIFFNQDEGEAKVNTDFLSRLYAMKEEITTNAAERCNAESSVVEYVTLYRHLTDMVGVMNVPIIQGLIHYITIEADARLIELYILVLLPQLRSCNPKYMNYLMETIGGIRRGDYVGTVGSKLMEVVALVQSMYSCLGTTCKEVGEHSGGIFCNDCQADQCTDSDDANVADPIRSFGGYMPKKDVRSYARIDRDVNQLSILVEEGNIAGALDLYEGGKNVKVNGTYVSLKSLADYTVFDHVADDDDAKRIYIMYQKYYEAKNYADRLMIRGFQNASPDSGSERPSGHYLPPLIKALIGPQYAMRAFFAASDICMHVNVTDVEMEQVQEFWDRGAATLVGSIESEVVPGTSEARGMSWYALGYEYCDHFNACDENGDPKANVQMIEHITNGARGIARADCSLVLRTVRQMESLLLVTIMQGMLYHTAMREKTQSDMHYGAALAFSRAIVPILDIRSSDDAEMIEESLSEPGQYSGAAQVWTATLLGLNDLGIDCVDLGEDNMLVLSKAGPVSFCQHIEGASNFPTRTTPSPTTRSPDAPPVAQTSSPTASSPSPSTSNDPAITINSDVLRGYQFTNMDLATMWAKIALDLRQILDLRSHYDSEHSQALDIYRNITNSDRSIESIGSNMKNRMEDDLHYNLYRHTFRTDSLFNSVGGGSYADEYASKIINDAFEADGDVDLAYEGIITLAIWMEVIHLLETAVRECAQETDPGVIREAFSIDQAVAYYVGVGQSLGRPDGHLLYSFAHKSAAESGTIDAAGEATANAAIMKHFIEAKDKASKCDGSPGYTEELHESVGKIMSMMNVPLVQSFYQALKASVETGKTSFYVILYGLTTLPQIANCQPSEYEYLSEEIIGDEGFDVTNAEALLRSFRKTYSCYGITSMDVHGNQLDAIKMPNMYAGFAPIVDVRDRAIKDREVFVMGTLMAESATEAAENFFTYGHFVRFPSSTRSFQSLRQVADSTSWLLDENRFDLTASRGAGSFNVKTASDLIVHAIRGTSVFSQSTKREREDAVLAGLQSLVLLPAAMGYMGMVATVPDGQCTLSDWDTGASMIVGSIEGAAYGGDERKNGVSMYRLAAGLCDSFDMCTTSSTTSSHHAQSNEVLIEYFTNGESMISSDGCQDAATLTKEKVVPNMLGSLIQGIVEYSSSTSSAARGYMYSQVMFPIVEAINATSSATLENNAKVGSEGSRPALIEAFAHVLEDLNINCEDIGDVFCLEENKSDTTDLSDGLYVTTTFVENFAKIDLDIEGMTKALDNGNIALAKDIYTDGLNSELLNESGRKIGVQSVRNLSLASSSVMDKEPVFNLFRHTFKDVFPFSFSVDTHADAFVDKYFEENFLEDLDKRHHTIAAEAAVALNIWAHVVHKLYETLDSCLNNDFSMDNEGVHMIDEAVAYYIGSKQETGSHLQGYLLYGLAEKSSEMFDVGLMNGQSLVNRKILRYLKEAALNLTFNNGCSQPGVVANLGVIIQKTVSQMTIPLIQHLIYFLKTNDRERARLYSHAVIPLLSPCTAETYHYLKKELITDLPYDSRDINDIIRALQSTYRCIGITCDEVGSPRDVDAPICERQSELASLAGYTPTTDVREFSDLDSDIRYIQILLGEGATSAAKYIYQFGRHSTASENVLRELLTLKDLATSADRKFAPTYFIIDNYFPSGNEADNQVSKYMGGLYSPNTSKKQVQMIVTGTLKYEILYLAALEKMQLAIIGCKSTDQNRYIRGKEQWDAAAAMIIGPTDNSRSKGDLLYDLADKHCAKFGTCDMKTGEAISNEELESLFYAGSYLMKTQGCTSLEAKALQVEITLLTIFLQATIYSAYENNLLDTGINQITYAEGYALSRVVLPYLDSADTPAAATIKRNLDFQLDYKPVRDGFVEVANSFRKAISKLDYYDVDCKKIGSLDGKDFCLSSYEDTSSASRIGYWSIAVAGIATILYII